MWKKRNFPEVSSDLCQDIMKGRGAFVIPGCLCNRNALVNDVKSGSGTLLP
jgi:hypothetical protein